MQENDNETEEEPGVFKKFLLVPCMSKSLMYGISGGLGVGLGHFLLTSNIPRATNVGFGGYLVVLFGTWGVCRYQLAQARFRYSQVQEAMDKKGHSDLTSVDPKNV